MQYLFYDVCTRRMKQSEQEYKRLCGLKEAMFNATQPRAKAFDRDKIQISKSENTFEHYLIKLDESRIDDRINEALSILTDRKFLVKMIEQDLQYSKDIYDKAYYYKYVRKQKTEWIAKMTGYSTTHIQRILHSIKKAVAAAGDGLP